MCLEQLSKKLTSSLQSASMCYESEDWTFLCHSICSSRISFCSVWSTSTVLSLVFVVVPDALLAMVWLTLNGEGAVPCASSFCFDIRWGLLNAFEINAGTACVLVGRIIYDTTRCIVISGLSSVGSMFDHSFVGEEWPGTGMQVCGGTTVCAVTQIVPTGVSSQFFLLMGCFMSISSLRVSIETGNKCHRTTTFSMRNIPWLHMSIIEVLLWLSTVWLWTIPNYSRTIHSPVCLKRKVVRSSKAGFLSEVHKPGNYRLLMFKSRLFFMNALLTRLKFTFKWRRNVCGSGCWALMSGSTATGHVDLREVLQ